MQTKRNLANKWAEIFWLTAKKFNKQQKVKAVTLIYDSVGVPQLTEKKIEEYFTKGFTALDKIKSSESKEHLIAFTKDLIKRQS
jgi:geranylgeranyl diphosphate synthase type II